MADLVGRPERGNLPPQRRGEEHEALMASCPCRPEKYDEQHPTRSSPQAARSAVEEHFRGTGRSGQVPYRLPTPAGALSRAE